LALTRLRRRRGEEVKVIWCKDIEDVINIARAHGWLFYNNLRGKHYYYVYAGVESELLCLAVEVNEPLKAKYVSIDDEGKLRTSDQPILPACARIVVVARDDSFEKLVE
jgi:hypothetical protein